MSLCKHTFCEEIFSECIREPMVTKDKKYCYDLGKAMLRDCYRFTIVILMWW